MKTKHKTSHRKRAQLIVIIFAVALTAAYYSQHNHDYLTKPTVAAQQSTVSKQGLAVKAPASQEVPKSAPSIKTSVPEGVCAANSGQTVFVSISSRHMWACDGTNVAYDSAVITGMENLPADLTPTGTYHIYAKTTDVHLRGSDSTGSWDDHVYYWMPFLDNQYGTYGFHDATWRSADAFGNTSPYSSDASHGCVELPLAVASWLYNWASVGTTVTITS